MEVNAFVGNIVPFVQGLDTNIFGSQVSHYLRFFQAVRTSPLYVTATSNVGLRHDVSVRTSIYQQIVSNRIEFRSIAARVMLGSANNTIAFTHFVKSVEWEKISQVLSFFQLAVAVDWRDAGDTLPMTQSVGASLVLIRSITHSLGLVSRATGYIADDKFIATPLVTLTSPPSISLTFNTTTITLRNPDFGDVSSIEADRINRRTRGGDLVIYRDPEWPLNKKFKFSFTILKPEQISAFMNFVNISLGEIIALVDHEGRSWSGIISTPTDEIIQRGKFNYQVSFEFQVDES